jgi:hypothetical protein
MNHESGETHIAFYMTDIKVKGKVFPGLNLLSTTPWRRTGKWRYNSFILDLGTRWRFTLGQRAPGTHCVGSWLGPRSGLDAVKKRKSLVPVVNRTPAVQPIVRCYTEWDILAPYHSNSRVYPKWLYLLRSVETVENMNYKFERRRANIWICGTENKSNLK